MWVSTFSFLSGRRGLALGGCRLPPATRLRGVGLLVRLLQRAWNRTGRCDRVPVVLPPLAQLGGRGRKDLHDRRARCRRRLRAGLVLRPRGGRLRGTTAT